MPRLKEKQFVIEKPRVDLNPKGLGLPKKVVNLKKYFTPIKKEKEVSIEELPSHLDLNVVRVGGWWYVCIMDNILKTVVTQSKDGCSTFKEAFKNAVDQIPQS